MMTYFILLFTLLPAIELMILIEVGSIIGALPTVGIIIFTGVLGAYLARYQGLITIQKIQNQLSQGKLPDKALMEGLMILVGGVVLLTPGFVTDFIGFCLLIPITRILLAKLLSKFWQKMINEGRIVQVTPFNNKRYSRDQKDDSYNDIDI